MKRSSEEFILLTVCTAGLLGIAPFAAGRLANGEWLLGALDSALALILASMGLFVWRTRRVRLASIILAIFCMSGMVAVVHLKGASVIYWAYPTMATAFFLLTQREAVALNMLALAALTPALLPHMTKLEFAGILVTLVLVNLFAYIFAARTAYQRQQLELLATTDSLTGAGNRRALDKKITEVIADRQRTMRPASLLALDVDHFKDYNDSYGHSYGDHILRQLTETILARIRITDRLYRVGGEEFVVLALGADLSAAGKLAEDLRMLAMKSGAPSDRPITISLGIAEIADGESGAACLRRADEALYEAKRSGRNRTCLAKPKDTSRSPH